MTETRSSAGRLICVVNNYNYERFLGACLDSTLNQTRPFDAIIVVDDGSTDGSHQLLAQYESAHPQVTVLRKKNGGQLSCFNAALPYINEDDWVFLLDADDLYPDNYVEAVQSSIATHPGDFYFSRAVRFSAEAERLTDARISETPPLAIPLSSAITITSHAWIGSPTSALVVSGWLYHQVLPYAFERDWITCADELVVFAASIFGARKVMLRNLGICYRIHGNNLYAGVRYTAEQQAHSRFRRKRLVNIYAQRAGLSPQADYPGYLRELALIPKPERRLIGVRGLWRVISRRIRGRV